MAQIIALRQFLVGPQQTSPTRVYRANNRVSHGHEILTCGSLPRDGPELIDHAFDSPNDQRAVFVTAECQTITRLWYPQVLRVRCQMSSAVGLSGNYHRSIAASALGFLITWILFYL